MNEVLINSMPNSWSKQAYVQGFDCKSINFKKAANMFECMVISEYINEVVVEPLYEKYTRADSKNSVHSRQ